MSLRSPLRVFGFTLALAIALIAIIVRLTQVQVVQGETYAAAARANQVQLIPVAAPISAKVRPLVSMSDRRRAGE